MSSILFLQTFALRYGENNGADRRLKGKSMAETRPITRATLGQIENNLLDVRGSQLSLLKIDNPQ